MDPLAWIPLAEVARPHGVQGELRLKLHNRDSDLLLSVKDVLLRFASGEEQPAVVRSARRADTAILLKLVNVTDRDQAEALRGAAVCAQRRHFSPLDDGEFYVCDVEGAKVFVRSDAGDIEFGTVRTLQSYPTVDVLAVIPADGGKDYEVPLTSDYVELIDSLAGLVVLRRTEGLERG